MSRLCLNAGTGRQAQRGQMMRSGVRMQGWTRTTVVFSTCLALIAQMSGLTLAVHLSSLAHPAHHNSENCSICQQSCALSKKLMLDPPAIAPQRVQIRPEEAPESIEPTQDHRPHVHQARAPPCSNRRKPV